MVTSLMIFHGVISALLIIFVLLQFGSIYGAIVYRLGHQVFILRSGVRFPVALPYKNTLGPQS